MSVNKYWACINDPAPKAEGFIVRVHDIPRNSVDLTGWTITFKDAESIVCTITKHDVSTDTVTVSGLTTDPPKAAMLLITR